jgi:hypothetical protein
MGYRRFDFVAARVFRAAAFFLGPGFGFDLGRFVSAFEVSTSDSS